jgi:tripartite-type tricarboxylate transporter receptor subunit TctC
MIIQYFFGAAMTVSQIVARILSAGIAVFTAGAVCSQEFPNKPIRIFTSAAAGGGDLSTRIIAQGLAAPLGQQVLVDNRAIAGAELVAKSPPDGYTLLLYGSSIWISPLMQSTPWDVLRDFSPVMVATTAPNLLIVHPSLPVKSVKELIALAKSRPGSLNYATAGTGSSTHLAAELFKAMARVDIVRVNYKGPGAAITDLLAGEVQMMISTAASVTPHLKPGRLKAVAVGSAQPSALAPGLPTVAASGLPGYVAESPFGLFVPVRTPAAVIMRLNQETARVLQRAEVRDRLASFGIEPVGGAPEQLTALINADVARLGKIIRDNNIRE